MYRVILLFCLLAPLTLVDSAELPDPENCEFGPNTFCFFFYNRLMLPENLDMPQNAKLYGEIGKATLKKYRLDFGECSDGGVYFTVAPDDAEYVLGSTYEIPKSDYQYLIDRNNINTEYGHPIEVSVTVNKDGKDKTATCLTIAAKNMPPQNKTVPLPEKRRFDKESVRFLVSIFTKANLPEKYINDFEKFATA